MKETAMKILFLVCACISILSVIVICVFLFAGGFPAIAEIGFLNLYSEQLGVRLPANTEFSR